LGRLHSHLGRSGHARRQLRPVFFTLFLLFCRYLPMVAMAELKTVMPAAHAKHA